MESEEVSGNQTTINCSAEEWLNKAINDGHINYYEYKNFSDFKKIGKGGFGEVIKCEWKSCELTVALKRLTTLSEKIIEDFIKELKLLRKVDCHPNIIRFYGVTKEYANEGNLREYLIAKFTSLNWTDKLRIAKEIIRGLLFLHENNIIHRDLHSKNILIHQGQPKITDFGLSKHINASSNTSKSAIHGVPGYIDPQCFFNLEYKRNKKSDIYSFGVILWEISSGQCPTHYDEIKISVKGTSPEYVKLYKDCIDIDPASRPEAKSIFNILDQLFKGTIQSNDSIDNINTAETSSSSQLINGSTQSNDSAEKYITANETSSSSQQNHIKALSVSKVVAFDIPSSSQQNYTKTRSNSNEISELPSLGNFSKIELIQNNCSVGNKKELRSLTDNGVRRKESQLINGSTQSNDTVENITTDETLSSSQLINGSTQRNDSVEISYSSQQNHIKARSVYVRRKKRNKEIESLTTEKKHANLEIESNEEDIIDQPNTSAFKNRWEAHLKEGRYEDAIAELSKLLKIEQGDASALRNRGAIYRLMEKYEDAIADLNSSLKIEQNNPFALRNRGVTYCMKGRYKDAIADLSNSLNLEPNNAFALRNRGAAYNKMKKYKKALKDLEDSLKLEHDNEFALKLKNEIKCNNRKKCILL